MNGDTSVKRNSRAEKDVEKEDSIITADGQGRTENLRFDVSLFIWAAEGRLERQRKRTDAIAAKASPVSGSAVTALSRKTSIGARRNGDVLEEIINGVLVELP